MTPTLLDANVVLRFVLGDPPKQAEAARRLFEGADRGERTLHLPPLIVAECAYVLDSFYHLDRPDVAGALRRVVELPGVRAEERPVVLDALGRYERVKVDFADAYLAAKAAADPRFEVASFDKDFKKFGDVTLAELVGVTP